MTLNPGTLFNGRYLLRKRLGAGAYGEVWLATDTKADNLVVAIKILSQGDALDTQGIQDFQREFTQVFNLKHSNLLTPSGYDIADGVPFLVMQYCENGSCSSMTKLMEEADVIKFIHDVAAGLEYLHDHNIVHQDIKPDNILVDDNLNFMVTDFGISVREENIGSTGGFGGTRAYMGPERFDHQTLPASDIWALGATITELLTGDAPYGDHGGLLQAQGEPLPELPANLQPEVRGMILDMLNADPAKRPTAHELRQKTELYQETGKWKRESRKPVYITLAAVIGALIIGAAIWIWDYNRTKVKYYKDITEVYGVPQGIGRLSASEQRHRDRTYRLEYSKGKLRSMKLVNSKGNVDASHIQNSKVAETRYYYTDKGDLDYKALYNRAGHLMYKEDYDDALKTATIRQADEFSTEMCLPLDENNNLGAAQQRSLISRYLMTYDDNGYLVEKRFAGISNTPACDGENIYGYRYSYDDHGNMVEQVFLGADYQPTTTKPGFSSIRIVYDDADNRVEQTYYNLDGSRGADENNVSRMAITYDDYGNILTETYFNVNDEPTISHAHGAHGIILSYNSDGMTERLGFIDENGNPTVANVGISAQTYEYDDNGYLTRQTYVDETGKPMTAVWEGNVPMAYIVWENDDLGQQVSQAMYDALDQPVATQGYDVMKTEYNDRGLPTDMYYFDADGSKALSGGTVHHVHREYDEFDNPTLTAFFDADEKPASPNGIASSVKHEYNRQGALIKETYYDLEGNPLKGPNFSASMSYEYDEIGNLKKQTYLNENGEPMMINGFSAQVHEYDPKTNLEITMTAVDDKGNPINSRHTAYDAHGNVVKLYFTDKNGRMAPNTVVDNTVYDANNRAVEIYATDLSGKRINLPHRSYSSVKKAYDKAGNNVEQTVWGADGKAAVDENGFHRLVQEYDSRGNVVRQLNYDTSGQLIAPSKSVADVRVSYDQWNNKVEERHYNDKGEPMLAPDGTFTSRYAYDKRNRPFKEEYFDTDMKPVAKKPAGYSSLERTYDDRGLQTEVKFYTPSGLACRWVPTYTPNGFLTEEHFEDSNGKLTSGLATTFSKIVYTYSDDGGSVTDIAIYDARGQRLPNKVNKALGPQRESMLLDFNGAKGSSSEQQQANPTASAASSSFGDWRDAIQQMADACPATQGDGCTMTKVTFTSSSVDIFMKFDQLSIYEMDEATKDNIRTTLVEQFKPQIRGMLPIPSSVRLTIHILDKGGRQLFTF